MSALPETPVLSPQFCFNQTALRDFLRISRSVVDDTIGQNLNALVTPASAPFDPDTTATRQPRPIGKRPINATACIKFKEQVLFPSWQARDQVLHYCAGVATSPDPDDPENLLKHEEDERARQRVVNERLDPYSGRYFPRSTRAEALASVLRNENAVESIIRRRTWQTVGERCQSDTEDFEIALYEWKRRQ